MNTGNYAEKKTAAAREKAEGNRTKLVRNAIRCRHCGDVIESRHVHDFQRCSCGRVAVDGGMEYCRLLGDPCDMELLCEYAEDDDEEASDDLPIAARRAAKPETERD